MTKFICLTCGKSLEHATSVCTCGGRATRRPRTDSELEEEHNKKVASLWKNRKRDVKLSIVSFIIMIASIVVVMMNHILGTIVMAIGFTGLLYCIIDIMVRSSCPFCGRFLQPRLYYEHIVCCPYCGKRIIPITLVKSNPLSEDDAVVEDKRKEQEENDNINFWL